MKALKCPVWIYIPGITITIIAISCEKEDPGSLPALTTAAVIEITGNSAISGGNITDDGGSAIFLRGVVWSTDEDPTVDLNQGYTTDGTGMGEFTSSINLLVPGATYFIRAYAENREGTAYGQQLSFSTIDNWSRDMVTEIVEVTNPATGRVWMDRNLGATRAATSSTDEEAYGYLFQWGRAADGHQLRTSETSDTSTGYDVFILTSTDPHDWRSAQNDNLWQGENGTNNPCPPGFRLPTEAEWNKERLSWRSKNADGAFASPLKLPVAGRRQTTDGSINFAGSYGFYWSSAVDEAYSRYLAFFNRDVDVHTGRRAFGRSVRCIKDE